MLQNYWKFPNRNVQTFGFVYHDTNGLNHGPVSKTQLFLLSGICTVILWQTIMGKAIWENPIETRLGEGFQLGMLIRTPSKGIILICVCGWHQTRWEETKHWSDVEITQQRSRFGRTDIFPWSCILGMYSKTMWNKQRYCGQLQSHVWIANFRGVNWKTSILREFSYFFMVLWYGRSCKEMNGAILWVINDSTTLQSIYSLHRWPPLWRRRNGICKRELSQVCSQIVLESLYLARIGRPDILWSVNKLARSITKWTKAFDKRLNRLISYIHQTCEYKQYCYVGNTAKQCRLGLFQDFDFAGDLEDSKSTSGGTLCVLGSHTFVPISWMCKKQTSVSHSSTESEIISLDAGLRLDGIPALDLWDLIVSVLGNTIQTPERSRQPRKRCQTCVKHESEREQESSTRHVWVEACPPTAGHKARSEKTGPHLVEASSSRKTSSQNSKSWGRPRAMQERSVKNKTCDRS